MTAKQLTYLFSIPYFILAFLVISVKLLEMPGLENITKPLLLIVLMVWYIVDNRLNGKMLNLLFVFALFFSLMGDVFLMPLIDNFILGLVFFLLSHLFYIAVFLKGNYHLIWKSLKQSALYGLLVIAIYISLLLFLMPAVIELNSLVLLIAVPVYATVLMLMVLATIVYSKIHNHQFGQFVMIGGLLFLASDGILAINKFAEAIDNSAIWVMGSYVLAQWMLVYGYMNSKRFI